jgi:16S rRNA (adenine1518-N6/adenine1519-N6)-dimethyltransferase
MVYSLDLDSKDIVVEIGAGLGAVTQKLTEQLFEYGSQIYAVEIDERFVPKLEQMFLNSVNVEVVHGDILEWLPNKEFERDFKVLGSLPYYITSPILHTLVKLNTRPVQAVLLIQKEVAEKVSSKAPEASYLSTFMQTFFEIDCLKKVPRGSFKPVPKVDGGIISLKKKDVSGVFKDLETIKRYEGFLHKGFSSPRKMLNKPFKKEELELAGVNGKKRPQELAVDEWVKMFKTLILGAK